MHDDVGKSESKIDLQATDTFVEELLRGERNVKQSKLSESLPHDSISGVFISDECRKNRCPVIKLYFPRLLPGIHLFNRSDSFSVELPPLSAGENETSGDAAGSGK